MSWFDSKIPDSTTAPTVTKKNPSLNELIKLKEEYYSLHEKLEKDIKSVERDIEAKTREPFKFTLKPRIKQILSKKGLRIKDLSRMTGINQGTISRLANNKRHHNLEILYRLCRPLNVTIEQLIGIKIDND